MKNTLKNKIIAGAIGLAALVGTEAKAAGTKCEKAYRDATICRLDEDDRAIRFYKGVLTVNKYCEIQVDYKNGGYQIFNDIGCTGKVSGYIQGKYGIENQPVAISRANQKIRFLTEIDPQYRELKKIVRRKKK